jgi:hypothetical protein
MHTKVLARKYGEQAPLRRPDVDERGIILK